MVSSHYVTSGFDICWRRLLKVRCQFEESLTRRWTWSLSLLRHSWTLMDTMVNVEDRFDDEEDRQHGRRYVFLGEKSFEGELIFVFAPFLSFWTAGLFKNCCYNNSGKRPRNYLMVCFLWDGWVSRLECENMAFDGVFSVKWNSGSCLRFSLLVRYVAFSRSVERNDGMLRPLIVLTMIGRIWDFCFICHVE